MAVRRGLEMQPAQHIAMGNGIILFAEVVAHAMAAEEIGMQGFDKAAALVLANIGSEFPTSLQRGGADLEHGLTSG